MIKVTIEGKEVEYNDLDWDIVNRRNYLGNTIEQCKEIIAKNQNGMSANLCDGLLLMEIMKIADYVRSITKLADSVVISDFTALGYLFLRDCKSRLDELGEKLSDVKYHIDYEHLDMSDIELAKYDSVLNDVFAETYKDVKEACKISSFSELHSQLISLQNDTKDTHNRLYMTIRHILVSCLTMLDMTLEEREDGKFDIDKLIEDSARAYSLKRKDEEYDKLKQQAWNLSESNNPTVSVEQWCQLLKTENLAYELAEKGELLKSDDECIKVYSDSDKKLMEQYGEMAGFIKERFAFDKLFDFSGLSQEIVGLFDTLNSDNMNTFYRLVLRGNIIRSEMNEALKRQFEGWMREETYIEVEDKIKVNEDIGKNEFDDKASILKSRKAMIEWKKLQNANLIDENLQPKTTQLEAAIIASVLGDKLQIIPKWRPFEALWGIPNLATVLTKAIGRANGSKYIALQNKVQKLLGISNKRD